MSFKKCLHLVRRLHYRTKMKELDDFIGKFRILQQAGKHPGRKRMGNSLCLIGQGGPGQHSQQQKAQGAQKGPAQQRCCEKRASALTTQEGTKNATAEATAANEDATVKDGPNRRVDKVVAMYDGKVRVSAAGMRTAEGSKAGMSKSTTSASSKSSNTTGTTFQITAEALFQTNTVQTA